MQIKKFILSILSFLLIILAITSCSDAGAGTPAVPDTPQAVTASLQTPAPELHASPSALPQITGTSLLEGVHARVLQEDGLFEETESFTSTPDTRKLPKYWPEWPQIPTVSANAVDIFEKGQELGNDIHAFSVIGDCQSEPSILMGMYDTPDYPLDDEHAYLKDTIRWFEGSFDRDNITVKDGMSVASVLNPFWADPKQCQPQESPLDCELRIHRPIIMFVNLGTNWRGWDDVTHEKYMRQIVDVLLDHGVVPILSTKGDNQEGDHRINLSIARVAYDYDIPMWNFWLSIRHLPGKGIDGSREGGYLTTEAWGPRSFSGLQALDAVWKEFKQ